MGGWKASGLGSRHGPDGIRKYAKRQSLMITPGYAPPRELHMFPYSAEVTRQVGDAISAARDQRGVHGRAAAHPARLLRHADPVAAAAERATEGRRAGDPTGSGRGPPRTSGVPEAIEVALLQSGPRGAARRPRLAARLARPSRGWSPEAPQEAREQLIHALRRLGPRGARRDPHAARADAVAVLRAPRPRHGPKSELGRDRLSGAAAPAPRRAEAARRSPPEAGAEAMTIEADVCVVGSGAGGGVIAGTLAEAGKQVCVLELGRLLQRGRLQPAGGLGLPEPLPARRADPDGRGPGLDAGRLVARRRHGDQLAELPADVPLGARAVGARARARGPRRRPTTTAASTR